MRCVRGSISAGMAAGGGRHNHKVSKQRAPMGPMTIEMGGAGAPRDDGTLGSVNRWALIADDDGERKMKPADEAQEVAVEEAQEPPSPLPAADTAVHNKGDGKRKKKKAAMASKVSEEEAGQSGGERRRKAAERVCKAAVAVAVALVGLLCQFVRDTLVAAGSLAV